MRVNKLYLYQFKNYKEKSFDFGSELICITGKNGSGKTSLLDAIYFLCFTKSYFVHSDILCVNNGNKGMRLKASFEKEEMYEVQCILRENNKKEFTNNGQSYSQLSKHIGQFPVVIITPDDTQIITEGSEVRRKFLDILISQIDESYMQSLMQYNKILMQRNALLKNGFLHDKSMLDIYDEQLQRFAVPVYKTRNEYTEMIKQRTAVIYHTLSGNTDEKVEVVYHSQLHTQNLSDLLKSNREKDIITQRTNYGVHKDDLIFSLNNMPFKNSASQGQRKSFLFGLKLAQYELLSEKLQFHPLLLLDDVFEKLDELRSQLLIDYIGSQNGQVFVTDTHKDRLIKALKDINKKMDWIEV